MKSVRRVSTWTVCGVVVLSYCSESMKFQDVSVARGHRGVRSRHRCLGRYRGADFPRCVLLEGLLYLQIPEEMSMPPSFVIVMENKRHSGCVRWSSERICVLGLRVKKKIDFS